MAQAAVKEMKPGSAIVNTGSVTGLLGSEALLDYSMTKGGIHAFARHAAGAARHPGQCSGAGACLDATTGYWWPAPREVADLRTEHTARPCGTACRTGRAVRAASISGGKLFDGAGFRCCRRTRRPLDSQDKERHLTCQNSSRSDTETGKGTREPTLQFEPLHTHTTPNSGEREL